jgi:hypothetical protein
MQNSQTTLGGGGQPNGGTQNQHGGLPPPGRGTDNGNCVMKCDRAQIECRQQAKTEEEQLLCGRRFQQCVADCNAPHAR